MKTQYACLHLDKAKGSDSAMSTHIERRNDDGTVYHPKSADPTRTHLNKELVKFSDGITKRTEAINQRIKTAGLVRKVSDNQVRAIRIILGGSHERMKELEAEGRIDEWCQASLQWAKDTWGADNVVSAVLHLDETTPHIHLTLVPITVSADKRNKKGKVKVRLAANDIMARANLRTYQDTYAQAMERFGLHRGVNGSKNKHQTSEEFFREQGINIKEEQAEVEKLQTKKEDLKEDVKGLQKEVEQKSAELQTVKDSTKALRTERVQIEEAVVKGKAENAKVLKENNQLQNANNELQSVNKELTAQKEQHERELTDLKVKGEETRTANRSEETKLQRARIQVSQTQQQLKEQEATLDTIINDGEQAKENALHFSYAAFDCDELIPNITIPPTFGKEEWAKKQQAIVDHQCRIIAEKAREPLISTITSQDETIGRLSKSLTAANKKTKMTEQRNELSLLVEEAVKAIIAFIDKPILKPNAENTVAKAYKAFLKDFFGDSELGRSLIREANLRIENGVRKQTLDKNVIQACLDFLLQMKDVAKSLLWDVLHPQNEREEENLAQLRR